MVAKYRSRSKRKAAAVKIKSLPKQKPSERAASKKGGSLTSDLKEVKSHLGFHHDESDLQTVLKQIPESAEQIKRHIVDGRHMEHVPYFPRYQLKYPDRSFDVGAFARHVFKKHSYNRLPVSRGKSVGPVGGGVTLEEVAKFAKDAMDPLEELGRAKKAYDGVNLHPTSFKSAIKSGFSAQEGNFAVGSAYMKTASQLFPAFAPEFAPAGQAMSYTSRGIGKINKLI